MQFIKNITLIIFSTFLLSTIPDYRVVAEWEPAIGTMIRWPLGIPSDLVEELASDDILYVLVESSWQQNSATNNFQNWGVNLSNVVFIYTDTYSHWTRDHGPEFIIGENHWEVINQQFNGYPENYGCNFREEEINYDDNNLNILERKKIEGRPIVPQFRGWDEDDDTNIDFANQLGWDIFNLPLYWTGGNFMTDGYGMGFSTQLMVNENNMSNEVFQEIMYQELHFNDYHIFDNPNELSIQHIDCMAKLVNPETIIIKQVSQLSPEYDCIENFAESFYSLNTFYGRPFKIKRIYCPTISGGPWEINPVAAYTNSLILNNKVLVPKYGIPEDDMAIQVFQEAMPGYEVIGFNQSNSDPWYGEDALHCRTKGIFDPEMIHVSHKSIRTEEINTNQILISADIIDYGGVNLESIEVHWKYSSEDGPYSIFNLDFESGNTYSGIFPNINFQSEIQYFIKVTNAEDKAVSHPIAGWHSFMINSIAGDINGDNLLNVQDVILAVNLVLANEFDYSADLNGDAQINIQDIVLLVNIILN